MTEAMNRIDDAFIERFFQKADLLPAIVQEAVVQNEVLMLAYMNRNP